MSSPTTHSNMPGAFNFPRDHGAAPRVSGAKSHLFQPPRTPSASASSSLYLTRSATSSMMSYDQPSINGSRKRSHGDYHREQTPNREPPVDPGSPLPFVNTRYALAGGMDTPTLKAAEQFEASASVYSDIGYRRELSGDRPKDLFGEESSYQSFPFDMDQESDDRSRISTGEQGGQWTKTALGVVGGVVGKVWEFCKTSAFRGFHAGGGEKYTVNSTSATHFTIDISERDKSWEPEKVTTTWGDEREPIPLPGRFPEDDFIADYIDRATPEATPPRAAKRRQVRPNDDDEIAKNWVVVPPTSTPSKPSPARYSTPTASSAGRRTTAVRPASRAGTAGASTRRSLLQRGSHAGPPALQPSHGASFASPRSPAAPSRIPRASPARGTPPAKTDSPASREAQRWATLKKKEEREADQSIRRLDAQLKAMIREGKEALGTKIEVEIDDD